MKYRKTPAGQGETPKQPFAAFWADYVALYNYVAVRQAA